MQRPILQPRESSGRRKCGYAEEDPLQSRTQQGDAEPIHRWTRDRTWRRILLPLKQAHQGGLNDTIRRGKIMVYTLGNGLPFPDRSLML